MRTTAAATSPGNATVVARQMPSTILPRRSIATACVLANVTPAIGTCRNPPAAKAASGRPAVGDPGDDRDPAEARSERRRAVDRTGEDDARARRLRRTSIRPADHRMRRWRSAAHRLRKRGRASRRRADERLRARRRRPRPRRRCGPVRRVRWPPRAWSHREAAVRSSPRRRSRTRGRARRSGSSLSTAARVRRSEPSSSVAPTSVRPCASTTTPALEENRCGANDDGAARPERAHRAAVARRGRRAEHEQHQAQGQRPTHARERTPAPRDT